MFTLALDINRTSHTASVLTVGFNAFIETGCDRSGSTESESLRPWRDSKDLPKQFQS
jgi:hypothetical protein